HRRARPHSFATARRRGAARVAAVRSTGDEGTMTIAGTLVAGARGATALRRATAEVVLVTAGAALVALGARLSVPLPFSQVPITGQTFAVLLVGAALGSGRGVASMLTYLAAAVAGLPIFSGGGCCLPWLLG